MGELRQPPSGIEALRGLPHLWEDKYERTRFDAWGPRWLCVQRLQLSLGVYWGIKIGRLAVAWRWQGRLR